VTTLRSTYLISIPLVGIRKRVRHGSTFDI